MGMTFSFAHFYKVYSLARREAAQRDQSINTHCANSILSTDIIKGPTYNEKPFNGNS